MKKILFLIPNTNFSFIFLFKIFLKYEKINNNKSLLEIGQRHILSKKNNIIGFSDLEWSFVYRNNKIDVILSDLNSLDDSYKAKYDDIIVFESRHDFNNHQEYSDNVKYIFLATDELPHTTENVEYLIKQGSKIISSSNIYIDKKYPNGYFYEYKLSFLFYYYFLGLYHLPLENPNISKKNILGFYHKVDYKNDRDEIINKINKIFKNKNNNLLKNYSISYDDDFASLIDLKYFNGWGKVHITSYTDYINSICTLIFESDGPWSDIPGQYHPTEKLVKSLIFSKLNILSLLYCNDNLMIELYQDGFWFLNFNFIDFKIFIKSNSRDRLNMIVNSIENSIEFLLDVFQKNNNDLQKTNKNINEMFSYKMQNNYKLFNEVIKDIKIQDDIMDFILDISNKKVI